jgi:hypothetical protein
MIPPDQAQAALQNGGQPAVSMIDPSGTQRYVPQSQKDAALQAGGQLAPDPSTQPQLSLLGKEVNWLQNTPGMQIASGAMKGLEKTGAGAIEQLNQVLTQPIIGSPYTPGGVMTNPVPEAARTAVSNRAKQVSDWLRTNTETHGWEKVGDVGETVAELLALPETAEAKGSEALSWSEHAAQAARQGKFLEQNPVINKLVRIGLNSLKGGGEVGAQTLVKTNDPEQAARDAALGVGVGGVMGVGAEGLQAAREGFSRVADKLRPTIENVAGTSYRRLASEAVGPEGQSLATPLQQEASTYATNPAVRAERAAAFRQLNPNLARTGLENALNASNAARGADVAEPTITAGEIAPTEFSHTMPDGQTLTTPEEARPVLADLKQRLLATDDPQEEQALQQQVNDLQNTLQTHGAQPSWNYISPSGQSLSPGEARAGLNDLREHWLSQDWGPQQDAQIQSVYNDLKGQLDRHEQYLVNRPHIPAHEVEDLVGNTHSFGDAAEHMRISAGRTLAQLPEDVRGDYLDLANERQGYQDAFDRNTGVPQIQAEQMAKIDDVNQRMQAIFKDPEIANNLSPAEAEQGLKDQRLSDAFKSIQNMMNKHLTLSKEAEAATGIPSVPRRLPTLADDVEKIRSQYGDVLNPVLGDQGLNHIIQVGEQMRTRAGADEVQGLLKNIAAMYKRHYINLHGLQGAMMSGLLYHTLGHAVGVAALPASIAEASITGSRKFIINRMANDPAFAGKVLYAVRNRVPSRVAAMTLAGIAAGSQRTNPPAPTGDANATGQ